MVAVITRGALLKAALTASSLTLSPSFLGIDTAGANANGNGNGNLGPTTSLFQKQPQALPAIPSVSLPPPDTAMVVPVPVSQPTPIAEGQYYGYAPAASFVRKEITRIVREEDPSLAGSILRLAFHDATVRSMAADPSIGGADGSIRYELEWPENRGLSKPLAVVTKVHEEQLERFRVVPDASGAAFDPNAAAVPVPLSFADTLALAGAAAVEAARGPKIPVRLGRRDKEAADNRFLDEPILGFSTMAGGLDQTNRATIASSLPSAGLDSLGLRNYFRRLGLTEGEMVALSGAHDLGRHVTLLGMSKTCLKNLTRTCLEEAPVLSPFVTEDPDTLSNRYFATLLRWNKREIEYGEALFIPTDVALVVDDGLKKYVAVYANNEKLFFHRFRTAYQKLVDSTATSRSRF